MNDLFERGIIDASVRSYLEKQSEKWQVPAHTLLRTFQLISPEVYVENYSRVYGVPRIIADEIEWNSDLGDKFPWLVWVRNLALPVITADGREMIVSVDPVSLEEQLRNVRLPKGLILEEEWVELAGKFRGKEFLELAINGLWRSDPQRSARITFTRGQLATFWGMGSVLLIGIAISPVFTLTFLNGVVNFFYFLCTVFKTLLVLVGSTRNISQKVSRAEIEQLNSGMLPKYTILVPVYKEPEVIPHLVEHLKNLSYPLSKLDVKVLLEEGDVETIRAFRESNPPPNFHALVVPNAQPKTKPKACNYGLYFAAGEYLTIYDAEDLPEADQLEKVVIAFQKLPRNVVCIQACLNYFNWRENLLTRMFTLEYSMWFDYNLPGMESLKIPIPLGGTSNHFKTQML
ncbi:MAG: glycosyltransferase, partial [Chthoniobacterales bacterium]|nr:glycosyltransferase [Chthoniobacterales bacterium]